MSRARLGLYVFARSSLFSNCFELTPTFRLLLERPTQLHLLPKELHPTQREIDVPLPDEPLVIEDMPRMAGFVSDFYRYRVAQIANDPEVSTDSAVQ
jgi:intron-binding protein aquarius